MKFSNIVGQPVLVRSLKNALVGNKVANGYVIAGPKGCGKKLISSVFALALNCKENINEIPCGVCSSCVRFNSGNHSNIEIIKPTGASIKIEQIRQIISDTSKTSLESGYKVIIFDKAEKMTLQAQDAFLKTLEEPIGNTVFILLVENQYSMLPTILSRCQVFNVSSISNEEIRHFITRNYNYDEIKVRLATAQSNGIIGRAIQILQDESYFSKRDLYKNIVKSILNNNYSEISNNISNNIEGKEDTSDLLEFILFWFRDVLVLKELKQNAEEFIVNIDELEILSYFTDVLTHNKIQRILDIVKKTLSYLKYNVTSKNSLEGMILSIMEVNNG